MTALAMCIMSAASMSAQQTIREMELLTVNEHVTTMITATEPIRLVDISTTMVAADQPVSNVIRLKPKEGADIHADGDILAVVTIITERYRAQYGLVYTTRLEEAVTDKTVDWCEAMPYDNPAVSLSTEDMASFARKIWNTDAMYRNVATRKDRMTMRLNNIYSVGEYFFLDFSVQNRTNIRFDIDQIRFKLRDKKQSRATNCQEIELTPAFVLEKATSFRFGYRNVVVLRKQTFPDDKVLSIEMSERQISGRTITLDIDYEDVLSADSFSDGLLKERRR